MPASRTPSRRTRRRTLLPGLGVTGVGITCEGRRARYLLQSCGTRRGRHRLTEPPTQEPKAVAMAQIRQAPPRAPDLPPALDHPDGAPHNDSAGRQRSRPPRRRPPRAPMHARPGPTVPWATRHEAIDLPTG